MSGNTGATRPGASRWGEPMRRTLLVAILLASIAVPVLARDNPFSRPLTEEQLRTLVPILKAEGDLLDRDRTALRSDPTPPASFDPRRAPAGPAANAPFELAKVLRKERMCAERYQDAKIALALARSDARNAALTGAAGAHRTDADAGSPLGNDELRAERESLDVRWQNVELYRRHAAELDPLLDRVL